MSKSPGEQHEANMLEPLDHFVVLGIEALHIYDQEVGMPVSLHQDCYSSSAQLPTGEELIFKPISTAQAKYTQKFYTDLGFGKAEIESGIGYIFTNSDSSHSKRKDDSEDEPEPRRRLYISGILDPSVVKVLRQQDGETGFVDSYLLPDESATIIHTAFLSQLAGYIAQRYGQVDAHEALAAFTAEVAEASQVLDAAQLDSMFYRVQTPYSPKHTPLVLGTLLFDSIIKRFQNTSPAKGHEQLHEMVMAGDYFPRILQLVDGLQPQPSLSYLMMHNVVSTPESD